MGNGSYPSCAICKQDIDAERQRVILAARVAAQTEQLDAVRSNLRAAGVDPDSGDLGEVVLKAIRVERERAARATAELESFRKLGYLPDPKSGRVPLNVELAELHSKHEGMLRNIADLERRLEHATNLEEEARVDRELRVAVARMTNASEDTAVPRLVELLVKRIKGTGFDRVWDEVKALRKALDDEAIRFVVKLGVTTGGARIDGARTALDEVLGLFTDEDIPF